MNMMQSIPVTHLLPNYLHTGVDLMDRQHSALFNLMLSLKSGLVEMGLANNEVRQELFQLQADIFVHFSTEEQIAQDAGLDFTSHRHEHQRLISVFDRQMNDLLQGRTNIPAFLAFVDHWFENHIRQMDIPFGQQIIPPTP